MIFVTVGTHEQQFNRLVQTIDEYKQSGIITEEVIIQTGYSTFEPKYCQWSKFFPYDQMLDYVNQARIVVTHGGPSSFIMPLQVGKVPVVVPRQKFFGEHVNDHQIEFCRAVAQRYGSIYLVEDTSQLANVISSYEPLLHNMLGKQESNNLRFNEELRKLIEEVFQ